MLYIKISSNTSTLRIIAFDVRRKLQILIVFLKIQPKFTCLIVDAKNSEMD